MKKTTKLIAFALIIALGTIGFAACGGGEDGTAGVAGATEKLVIYNWEEYIGVDVWQDFATYYKAQTGNDIEVTYSTFDTNETMMTQITKGDSNVDLICPSEYAIQKLQKADQLVSIVTAQTETGYTLKNTANINDVIYTKVQEAGIEIDDYFVPYMWGTLGILYNADVVTEADLAKGWGLLWNENGNEKLNGKIMLKDSIRDTYAAAVLYLKGAGKLDGTKYAALSAQELINCTETELLALAETALIEQQEVYRGYEVDFGKQDMIKGKAYVDLAWSGDAMYAIEEAEEVDVNLKYFTPDTGCNIWFDGWSIPKTSQNQKAALMFIDYMLQPEIAARNMVEIGYTAAVDADVMKADQAAMKVLSDNDYDTATYFEDTTRYPDTTAANLGVMKDFAENGDAVNQMWERVKANGSSSTGLILIIVGIVVVIGVVVALIIVKGKKGNKRRRVVA